MPVNKRSKYRGSRTCGGGTHKNRRGAGNRGGRGHSGGCKHHFVRYYLESGPVFGKSGFHHPDAGVKTLDIGSIDQIVPLLLHQEVITQEGDTVVIDAGAIGIEKVLGSGKVTRKLKVTANAFSEQAKAKIEAMGGQALIG
jgi:large subunit ribosomal protein L15